MQRQMRLQNTVKRDEVASWRQMMFGACSGYTLWVMIYPIVCIPNNPPLVIFILLHYFIYLHIHMNV
jgi:hypothetical protein